MGNEKLILRVRLLVLLGAAVLLMVGCSSDSGSTPQGNASVTVMPWQFWDPADPGAPMLFEKGDAGYKLKAGWTADSVEYLYQWTGEGKQPDDYQSIERNSAGYTLDGKSVPAAAVDAFISALDHLYPTQLLLSNHASTDDYPHWTVEVKGADGPHILVESSSTGNPGYGPWNVLYNGRLYAQYDGALGKAIGKLFGGRLADPKQEQAGAPDGSVSFSTGTLPPQLLYGFWGLVPISNGFRYSVDVADGNIYGQITGESADGKTADQVEKLMSVRLMPVDHTITDCKVQEVVEDDPSVPVTSWRFTCQVNVGKQNSRYTFGISVQFGNGDVVTRELTGGLYGAWVDSTNLELAMPLPAQLDAAFLVNPAMKDLLTDNSLAPVTYKGKVQTNNPMDGQLTGEAIFLGQTEAYSQPVRYSVGSPFVLSNAQLSRWALNRATLDSMLQTIIALPTTRRVVKGAPAAALNMWYTNASGIVPGGYSTKVEPCGDSVPGGSFPTDNKPLEAFGYSLSPSFRQPDFVLVNGKPVVVHLDTYFYVGLDPARAALVPDVFNTGSSRAFQRISLENNVLKLFMPSDATPAERDTYEKIVKSLPGTLAEDANGWTISGVTFVPNADGSLGVVGCSK